MFATKIKSTCTLLFIHSLFCSTGDNLDLLAIVTGVAVAKARDGLIIFFGCHPNWPGVGGAGLITLSADWQVKKIFSVTDNKLGKRYAGSIFTTDVISDKCNGEDVPPHICTSVPLNNPPSDDPYVRKGDRDGNSTTSNTAATSKSFTSLTWTIIFFWHLAWLTPVCHQTWCLTLTKALYWVRHFGYIFTAHRC